jgi:hypothetical protein
MRRSTISTPVAAAALAMIAGGVALPASAAGDDVRTNGSCSANAVWKLKAKADDGRLEVEGEVDVNRNGQQWAWKIVRNGTVVKHGRATTRGPSGSFSVQRKIGNPGGSDRIGWRAKNPATGQTCGGSLSI